MAKRAKNVPAVDVDALVTVFCTLATFDSSESDPVSVQEMADELDAPLSEKAFDLLETLADAELIEFERGKVWISREDVTETNAEDVAVNALNGFTPVSTKPRELTPKEKDYAERTAYNAAVAASQEPGSQHLHPMEVAHAIAVENAVKAVTPVIAENGENVTIPVDFDDPSKGRRELDASKGERLISEDVITVRDKVDTFPNTLNVVLTPPSALPVIDGLDQFIDAETGDMVYESRIVKSGLALDEPDSIPEVPEGVNANTWDMAHTAITQSARDYWLKVAKAQEEQHTANAA